MAKRGYKLQEFVAHSGSVNCLKIGKKNFRQFVTGGDDQIVNLWSIGNPEPVTSLTGHTSPVESVAFDFAEVLVVAGASSGAIKLWDLEEKKMVRTLSGHRSYCTAAEFHPFGEFFASGSMDTNLKMWDIRKKGCIHTYKGHTRGISTIRFSPDGRWVVSGGFDNVVKIWDLTAGKLLHDFKHHEGHIRSIDFHPLEFLLATGSADKTVKFWDLETFEMIGSSRRESAGVRSITFHPDGRTLFCGLDDSLKVYSWEPVICHDSVDMGWSTVGDLCIHDGKLLGGAYFQNSVGVWAADIAFIERYGSVDLREQSSHPEQKHEHQRVEQWKSNSSTYSTSDVDSNAIKNIYVDSCNPVTSRNAGSLDSPNNVIISEIKDTITQSSQKKRSAVGIPAKTNVSADAKSVTVPTIVPRDIPEMKDLTSSIKESFVSSRASAGMVKPSHVRKLSITKSEMDNKLTSSDPLSLSNITSTVDPIKDLNLISRLTANSIAVEFTVEKDPSIKNVEESDKASILTRPPSRENGEKAQDFNQEVVPVRVVNGVAVVRGRTRSLVERFEKKEALDITEAQLSDRAPDSNTIAAKTSPTEPDRAPNPTIESAQTIPMVLSKGPQPTTEAVRTSLPVTDEDCHPTTEAAKTSLPVADEDCHPTTEAAKTSLPVADEDCHPTTEVARTSLLVVDEDCHPTTELVRTSLPVADEDFHTTNEAARRTFLVADEDCHPTTEASKTSSPVGRHPTTESAKTCTPVPFRGRNPATEAAKITSMSDRGRNPRTRAAKTSVSVGDRSRYPTEAASARTSLLVSDRFRQSTTATASARTSLLVSDRFRHPTTEATSSRKSLLISDRFRHPTTETARTSLLLPERGRHPTTEVAKTSLLVPERGRYPTTEPATRLSPVPDKTPYPRTSEAFPQNVSQLSIGRQEPDLDDNQIIEALMENHDLLLSTFRSRLTKLQMVRHFWEKKDFKGAINAMKRLPDHALQADVISVLVERMEIITLDMFSCLLPVLLGLLDSKVERHVSVSLEMLLKLTAAFGPLVRSTAAAPRVIGVDLHAEERIAMCKQCSAHLDNVQKILPTLVQRGGMVTRSALELNLVLQQS